MQLLHCQKYCKEKPQALTFLHRDSALDDPFCKSTPGPMVMMILFAKANGQRSDNLGGPPITGRAIWGEAYGPLGTEMLEIGPIHAQGAPTEMKEPK